jgi:hypothetical protein
VQGRLHPRGVQVRRLRAPRDRQHHWRVRRARGHQTHHKAVRSRKQPLHLQCHQVGDDRAQSLTSQYNKHGRKQVGFLERRAAILITDME